MNRVLTVICLIFVICTLSYAQDESEESSCPMLSLDGPYSYDPTSMTGPMSWGFIKPEYSKCTTGMQQSPIDFSMNVDFDYMMNGPKLMLMKSNMTFKPLPSNWEMECEEPQQCGSTMFNGSTYYVSKLRFSRPSQHTLNGSRYPFEAFIEHKSMESNKTVIIAKLFNVKKETGYFYKLAKKAMFDSGMNELAGMLLHKVKMMNNSMMDSPVMIDLSSIVKPDGGFCSYMGSLAAPPCTEGVMYFLSMDVGVVSRKQLHQFWATTGFSFDGNNRPTKPTNGRRITCFIKPDMLKEIEDMRNNMTMPNFNGTMGNGTMMGNSSMMEDGMMSGDNSTSGDSPMADGDDTEEITV